MELFVNIAQIVVSVALIIFVLLQERSSGLSGVFGGDSQFYQTRRGLEKIIFFATVIFAILFIILALADIKLFK